ncbi:MAG TPA: lytic murein transglycosylase B [Gammaproteobacteria bacterium]|nr:lytic murein transglycosylase B [Gammaproteobacteria bacterium]
MGVVRGVRPVLTLLSSITLSACISAATVEAHQRVSLDDSKEIAPFIQEMETRHGYPQSELREILAQARVLPEVIELISRPAEAKPWYAYRPIFLNETRITKGVEFWKSQRETLARAEAVYGVPAEIIVAIIGVETLYGERAGRIRVLDSLVTLGFRYPKRARFFRSELQQFLLLSREESLDPLAVKGSYAGAMGVPQFIASSYRRYAVDFDDDGSRDLIGSTEDAIGSVANYLSEHGWRADGGIAAPASVSGDGYKTLLKKGLNPETPLQDLDAHGVKMVNDVPADTRVALIELELADGSEYWVVQRNFYAITRYNHSPLYAMAVTQLAREIRTRMSQAG